MSWRRETAERLERMTALSPEAIGTGPIDRKSNPWWRTSGMTRSTHEAGSMADALMGAMVERGRKFRPHARETILVAFELGSSVDKITELVEAYMIPQGIEMPWGVWVNP